MSFGQTCVRVFCVAAPLLLSPPVNRADAVKLTARPAFRNVAIRDFSGDRLVFRGVSQQDLRKPFHEVEWIELDRLPALSVAEQARSRGQWADAARGYEDALGQANTGWLQTLIRVRLVEACDQSGEFGPAVAALAELIATSPESAARCRPKHPGPPGSAGNQRARATLERTLSNLDETGTGNPAGSVAASPPGRRSAGVPGDALRTLLLELAIYDELPDLPPPPGQITVLRAPPPASSRASEPEIGILPDVPAAAASQPVTTDPGPAPRLHADSLLLDVADAALRSGDAARAVRLVDRGLPYVPVAERAPWRLMLGRAQIEAGQAAPAAADLVALATQTSDPAVAARALYYVGWAHERLGQPDVARRVYSEVLERKDVPTEIRAQAEGALKRVQVEER
jgi:tetratricopeptide (TPR) repeat protein